MLRSVQRCYWVGVLVSLTCAGCGDDDGGGVNDAGGVVEDSGSIDRDSGSTSDAGNSNDGRDATMPVTLAVGTAGPGVTAECLAWVDEEWVTGSTAFTDEMGNATNQDCVLVPVVLPSETDGFWISGDAFDVELRNPQYDGDVVRHAISTTEDSITEGMFDFNLFVRDDGPDGTVLTSGELSVGDYRVGNPVVEVSVLPGS